MLYKFERGIKMEENNQPNENLEPNKPEQEVNQAPETKPNNNFNVSSNEPPKKKGNGITALPIIIGIIVVAIVAGLIYYFAFFLKAEQMYKRIIGKAIDSYTDQIKEADYKTINASLKLSANIETDNKSIDMFASVNDLTLAQKFAEVIKKMCIIKELTISEKDETNLKKGALAVTKLGNFYLIETEENKKEQIEKLSKEIEKLNFEISRSEKMLGNERFVEKAPKELVAAEKEKLQKNKDALLEMEIKLKGLQNN